MPDGRLVTAERQLRLALKRLAASDTRIKRRNARAALFRVLKQIKNGANAAYPRIEKPKLPPAPKPPPPAKPQKPAKPWRLKLPFRKPYTWASAELFRRLVWFRYFQTAEHRGVVATSWLDLVKRLGLEAAEDWGALDHVAYQEEVAGLYEKFWAGEVFVADLELAAEHQAWHERQVKHGH